MSDTRIHLVEGHSSFSFSSGATAVAAFLSEQDAKFHAWSKNHADGDLYSRSHYTVRSVPVIPVVRDPKLWKKFADEQLKEIDVAIAKNTDHSAEDLERVEKLSEERAALLKTLV